MSTKPKFIIGQELTHYELQQAFFRIFGAPLPHRIPPTVAARTLAGRFPLRFEHEVNRLRGWAVDV